MKTTSDFLAQAESSGDVRKKMGKAQSADELVKLATDAGFQADKNTISHSMRAVASAALQKRGFPEWAINSMFLGDAVCW